MTRGEHETPRRPGKAATGRTAGPGGEPGRAGRRRPVSALAIAFAAALLATVAPPAAWRAAQAAKNGGLPENAVITEVRVEGNVTITSEKVRGKLLSRPGSKLQADLIDADVKSLVNTKWFSHVDMDFEADKNDPSGRGYRLIFVVREMPILSKVEFRGMTKLKLKEVEDLTSLKKGNRADATKTLLAVGQIKRLYEEKGYELAEVKLVKGGNVGDTEVEIAIYEGPPGRVKGIDFRGNVFATDATLRTKITSRPQLLGYFRGKYHRDNLEQDVQKLKEYYNNQGFFEASVSVVTETGDDIGDIYLRFVVSEGVRYQVRNISFEGNKRIPEAQLREGLVLHSGQPILDSLREADRKKLMSRYQALGCIDTQILPDSRYTDKPGVVDLVYKIEEGEPYFVGFFDVFGNERTRDKVIRREAAMAGILPGEPLDATRIDTLKKRLGNTGYFVMNPEMGKPIDIKIVNRRPHDQPYGENKSYTDPLLLDGKARMQGPEIDPNPSRPVQVPQVAPIVGQAPAAGLGAGAGANVGAGAGGVAGDAAADPVGPGGGGLGASPSLAPFGLGDRFAPPVDAAPIPVPIPSAPPGGGGAGGFGGFGPGPTIPGPPGTNPTTPPLGAGEPPGTFPSVPGLNANDVGPDRQDPFPGRAYADIVTSVEEAPTGRLMFGVGASSWQGLTGNLTIIEKNFDILNIPRSWSDFANRNAFRGAGQTLQIELMPGTLINRFMVTLREPYLFDLPIGASGSGYLFNRIYPNWTESREGGRFAIGRQFGTLTYADVAFRAEDVDFYGYKSPAPADYLAASGHTGLFTIRPSIRFDNRNAPFMTNKGQYAEFSYEQGWGSFTYPKLEAEGRTYFTLANRPDGSGKQILTLRGHIGATGRDTPVYERFFAGNFGSLRGFQYRGVGPRELGVNVGGIFEALGSVEYQVPLSANDMFNQVFFCDFGTVNSDYNFDNFRVSVGTGLRMVIPAFGPMPLAFDLAFPVEKANGDRVQYFNFTIGAYY